MFSIVEAAVVLVVLGVVATIVAPRMSRGAASSPKSAEQMLVGHLRALRTAIDAYAVDHRGSWPAGDVMKITGELTKFSDESGSVSAVCSAKYRFGPYMREIPALPVGARKRAATLGLWPQGPKAGWVYNPITGRVWADTGPGECDSSGRGYSTY